VIARVPDRIGVKSSQEQSSMPSLAPTSATLNPFRATSTSSSSSAITRTQDVDRGVEAFKRLMFSNSKEGSIPEPTPDNDIPSKNLAPPSKLEDSVSLYSNRTDHTSTGMTFVYSSDEEDDVGSAVKHSPETRLRESPQPILPSEKRTLLPPLSIPQGSPSKPVPPPSRKRGASGSNQLNNIISEDRKSEDKGNNVKRNLPPAPPAPRRTLSSASTSQHLDRSTSIRRDPQPSDPTKPPPPRPRRKLSDTSVTSVDILPPTPSLSRSSTDIDQNTSSRRLSTQAPPPPPPPRGRKPASSSDSPIRRSTDLPRTFDSGESPRRSSAPEGLPDSDLSLELGRLQREVDELVYGLTKKRGGKE
jgi:hypothetical protein